MDKNEWDIFQSSIISWWKGNAENSSEDPTQIIHQAWIDWKIFILRSIKHGRESLIGKVVDILQSTECQQRTPSQIKYLKDMCREFGFTGDIPQHALAQFCQHLEYENAEDNEVLFLQGERIGKNGKYFMQLSGRTQMYAIVDPKLESTLLQDCSRDKRKFMSSREVRRHLGTLVTERISGTFGEMALITGEPRTTSVIVTGHAQLVTCSRKPYREFLLPHHPEKLELGQKIRFLKGLSMLQSWGWSQISRLAFDLHLTELRHKDKIVTEGDSVSNVILICNGEACLEKEILEVPDSALRSNQFRDVSQFYTTVQVATIRPGTLIGDIEALNRNPEYVFSARVISGSGMSIYTIPVSKFRTHFVKMSEGTRNFIQESANARKHRYEERLELAKSSRLALSAFGRGPMKKPCTFEKELEKQGCDVEQLKKTSNPADPPQKSTDPEESSQKHPIKRSFSQKNFVIANASPRLRRTKSSTVLEHLIPGAPYMPQTQRDRSRTVSKDHEKVDHAIRTARERVSTIDSLEDYIDHFPPLIQDVQPRVKSCGVFLIENAPSQSGKTGRTLSITYEEKNNSNQGTRHTSEYFSSNSSLEEQWASSNFQSTRASLEGIKTDQSTKTIIRSSSEGIKTDQSAKNITPRLAREKASGASRKRLDIEELRKMTNELLQIPKLDLPSQSDKKMPANTVFHRSGLPRPSSVPKEKGHGLARQYQPHRKSEQPNHLSVKGVRGMGNRSSLLKPLDPKEEEAPSNSLNQQIAKENLESTNLLNKHHHWPGNTKLHRKVPKLQAEPEPKKVLYEAGGKNWKVSLHRPKVKKL